MQIRLQKYLAEAGVASRSKAEQIILDGRVSVNDEIITELGTKVETTGSDIVMLDGKVVKLQEKLVYIMLHKPEGCVTTAKDQFDRQTVMDYISDIDTRLYPVGRLDYDTSGLLLMTNDGDLTYKLTHPKHDVAKTYIAHVAEKPTKDELKRFEKGLIIDEYKTAPAKIAVVKNDGKFISLKIQIKEGRNRQVRKMCDAIGHPVHHLKRIATGKLFLGELKKGEYRHLTEEEVQYLKSI